MADTENRLEKYFEDLHIPAEGKADTIAGEIVRALSKISYRFYNDGDRIGVGYGNVWCNAPARFLIEKLPSEQSKLVSHMWGVVWYDDYEKELEKVTTAVLDWLDTTDLSSKPNTEDMLDWQKPCDVERYYEEDEEEYYEDDEWDDEDDDFDRLL